MVLQWVANSRLSGHAGSIPAGGVYAIEDSIYPRNRTLVRISAEQFALDKLNKDYKSEL